MITPKDKAKQLTDSFKDFVNPYIGSGMLSNTYDDDAILWQSKRCAQVAVDAIIESLKITTNHLSLSDIDNNEVVKDLGFWFSVKNHIESL